MFKASRTSLRGQGGEYDARTNTSETRKSAEQY